MLDQTTEKRSRLAVILIAFFVVVGVVAVFTSPIFAYDYFHKDKIYRGVYIGDVAVGNLTKEQARIKIETLINRIYDQGFIFEGGSKSVAISPIATAFDDIDLTLELLSFDVDQMIEDAYNYGRSADWFVNHQQRAKALLNDVHLPLSYQLDRDAFILALQANFLSEETLARNPQLLFTTTGLEVQPEVEGMEFDYDQALDDLQNNLALIVMPPIKMSLKKIPPELTLSEVENNLDQVGEFLKLGSFKLTYKDKYWRILTEQVKTGLYFTKANGRVQLQLSEEILRDLLDPIAEEINIPPTDAVLEFNQDKTKVTRFIPASEGLSLNFDKSIAVINNYLFDNLLENNLQIEVVVDISPPAVAIQDLNDLGIKELIAVGTSDYSGSPVNRRHNIEVGRKAFDGILLAPGEEFSALKALGRIDASNGYLPELVIKGNETVPEYGGGLCQVSTTMFRAALDGGLKITARRNHSYNVPYYAPTGTDATIYSPAPDFKFLNDTDNYILIHTINDTKNSKLIYQFWGSKDGRIVEKTDPVTYDWVSPPPTKLIETTDLPPGVKKCTERAHKGVKAYFDYKVTYADGQVHEERFHSTYRPWQEVCLIGVEEIAQEDPNPSQDSELPVEEVENNSLN